MEVVGNDQQKAPIIFSHILSYLFFFLKWNSTWYWWKIGNRYSIDARGKNKTPWCRSESIYLWAESQNRIIVPTYEWPIDILISFIFNTKLQSIWCNAATGSSTKILTTLFVPKCFQVVMIKFIYTYNYMTIKNVFIIQSFMKPKA